MIKKLTFVIILSLEIVYCSTQNSFKLKIGNQEYIITANNINDTFEVTINNLLIFKFLMFIRLLSE